MRADTSTPLNLQSQIPEGAIEMIENSLDHVSHRQEKVGLTPIPLESIPAVTDGSRFAGALVNIHEFAVELVL